MSDVANSVASGAEAPVQAAPEQSSDREAAELFNELFSADSDEGVAEASPEPQVPQEEPPEAKEPSEPEPLAPQPEPPVQSTPQPEPAQGQQSYSPTPEEYSQAREEIVDIITKSYSNFSDEDKEKLQVAPEEVLPRLVGRLFVDVYESVYAVVQQQMAAQMAAQVPRIMDYHVKTSRVRSELQRKFNEKWPQLADPRYFEQISHAAKTYAAVNPNATPDEWIDAIGATVSLMNKLPLDQAAPAPVPPPYRPPVPGAVRRTGVSAPTNPWTRLSEEWDEEI